MPWVNVLAYNPWLQLLAGVPVLVLVMLRALLLELVDLLMVPVLMHPHMPASPHAHRCLPTYVCIPKDTGIPAHVCTPTDASIPAYDCIPTDVCTLTYGCIPTTTSAPPHT